MLSLVFEEKKYKYRLYFICEEEYQPARRWYAETISWWGWRTIHSLESGYHNKFVPKLPT